MKNLKTIFAVGVLCASGVLAGCEANKVNPVDETQALGATPQSAEGDIIPDQYIITFHPSAIMSARQRLDLTTVTSRADKARKLAPLQAKVETEINTWLAKYGITEDQVVARYTTLQAGVALNIPKELYNRVSKDAAVASLEHDRYEQLPPFTVESVDQGSNRAQTTPCGITNAGGSGTVSTTRWIWIVDTGIDLDHPDLVVNTAFAANFASGSSADDCNGHGTHCAGIAAAANNTIGVVGVSAGATVVPVRVFGCSGGSATSTIVAGLNHVGTNDEPGDVVNVSLGGYYGTSGCATSSAYLSSINALANGGSRIAIAAGNNSSNAAYYQPACINGTNIFTIAAMTCAKAFASTYSNYGKPPVDYIATGSSVYSTYLNGGYATLTGTSMAAPHVAGVMHFRNAAPATGGNVIYGGITYPIAVR
jgi:subtilisin family serine protease